MNRRNHTVAAASLLAVTLAGAASAQTQPAPAAPAAAAPRVDVVPRRGLPGRDVALLVSGQEGGQIAVSIKVFPSASAGKPERIPWVADVPGFTLASLAEGDALELEFAVYLQRGSGEIVGHEQDTLRLTGIPEAWRTGGGLKVLGYVDTTYPAKTLRVLVREPASGAFGNWEMPVPTRAGGTPRAIDFGFAQVSDVQGGTGAMVGTGTEGMAGRSGLLALVAPDPAGAWLVVGLGGAGDDATAAPFSLAGSGSLPATRPVVRPGESFKVALLGEGLPGNLEAVARVIYSDGRRPEACQARIMSRLPAPAGPFERLDVAVTLPTHIPPGEHALVVTCRPAGGIDAGSVGTHFRVAPPDKTTTATSWPAIAIDETGRPVELPNPGAGARPSEEDAPPQLKAAVREAFARYAADGASESLRALVELERAALKDGSSSELGRLASAERSLARAAGKASPQALLGLCLVELDVYREHSRDAAYLAIGHSRRVIEETAEMLASGAKGAEEKRSAADVLTVFAASLQSVGSYVTADRLFVRAAALDGDDVAALMGRAAILERMGDPKSAISVLEQVLARRPGHPEAQLRLGVILARVNHTGAAHKALADCTAADHPAWVRAVAWQQLALMALEDGKPDEELRLLREGATALPTDPSLQVLLASALDRGGHRREAVAVVQSVVDRPEAAEPSARLLYAQPPRDDLDAVRTRLDGSRAACLSALAAADKEDHS
ncbi:MAG TPA: tetratricopeptide repeat protein [Thermoanaerobaculaceae bacterium]|nr:tetratricopeptide repeat protein [Thermoanaerobaculaceae bacterium]